METYLTPVLAATGSSCDRHRDVPATHWVSARIGNVLGDPVLGCTDCVLEAISKSH